MAHLSAAEATEGTEEREDERKYEENDKRVAEADNSRIKSTHTVKLFSQAASVHS